MIAISLLAETASSVLPNTGMQVRVSGSVGEGQRQESEISNAAFPTHLQPCGVRVAENSFYDSKSQDKGV